MPAMFKMDAITFYEFVDEIRELSGCPPGTKMKDWLSELRQCRERDAVLREVSGCPPDDTLHHWLGVLRRCWEQDAQNTPEIYDELAQLVLELQRGATDICDSVEDYARQALAAGATHTEHKALQAEVTRAVIAAFCAARSMAAEDEDEN